MRKTIGMIFILFSLLSFRLSAEALSESLLEPLDDFQGILLPKDKKECVLEEPEILKKSKSPIDGVKDLPKKNNVFFNLQFMVKGNNGESSFESVFIPRINLKSFVSQYAFFNEVSRDVVLNFKDDELRKLLLESESSLEGKAKEAAVDNSLLIYKLSQIKDEKEMYQTLAREMRSQPFERKVDFIANVLSYLSDNYDFSSLNEDGTDDIKVSDMKMLWAIGESIRTGQPVEAGVCRHMHQFAIKLAAAIGIKNPYSVGFVTTEYGHMTLVMEDPKDPTRLIQLNYGKMSETQGLTGPEALSQNHDIPSTGIVLKLFNHKDQHAINLPTELGGVLNRMAGGEDQDLSLDYKSRSQFLQVGVETPYGVVRFFHADSPLGNQEKVQGGAYHAKLKYNDLFYGEIGLSGFTASRPVENGELKTIGLYGRSTQGMNLKFYSSPNLNASFFSEFNLMGLLLCATDTDQECKLNEDGDTNLNSGVVLDYRLGDSKNRTSLTLQSQLTPNFATVNQDFSLDIPVIQLRHDTNFKITSSLDGNLGGKITSYQLGPSLNATYNGHLGLMEQKLKMFFQVNVDGRLTPVTPIWIPNSEHSVSGILGASIFDENFYIGIDGRKSFEIEENYFLGVGIGGNLGK